MSNRKEREAKAKAAAKEAYLKKKMAGKNAEGRADLERLRKIRAEREAAAAARKAEQDAKAAGKSSAKAEALSSLQ